MTQKKLNLRIKGMTCQGCADNVARSLKREKGVLQVKVDWKAGTGVFVVDPEAITEQAILDSRIFQGAYSAERAG